MKGQHRSPRSHGRRLDRQHRYFAGKGVYLSRLSYCYQRSKPNICSRAGSSLGIHASNDSRIMIFAVGIPLKRDGKVVGVISVSGGSGEQDHAVAEAGAAAC